MRAVVQGSHREHWLLDIDAVSLVVVAPVLVSAIEPIARFR